MRKFVSAALAALAAIFLAGCLALPFFPRGGRGFARASAPEEPYLLKTGGPGAGIELNSASPEVLFMVDSLAPFAREIIRLREELGGFESLEQLSLIKGVGIAALEKILPAVLIE